MKMRSILGAPTAEEEEWLRALPTTSVVDTGKDHWPKPRRTLESVMEVASASCWLPLVEGLLRLRPEKRVLAAQGPFVNCAQDDSSTRKVQAACFSAPGQLCPSLAAPIVVDIEAASDAPVLLKNPVTGQPIFRGERAKFAVLIGRLPQPLREKLNKAALLRKSAAELAAMGLQEWDEAEMARTGDVIEVGFSGRGWETCWASNGLMW